MVARKDGSVGGSGLFQEDLLMLEQENLDTERKMTEWFKENRRLLGIFEAMKDREIEMIFAAERCLQRNRLARVFYLPTSKMTSGQGCLRYWAPLVAMAQRRQAYFVVGLSL